MFRLKKTYVGVSKNSGNLKSSIFIGFSIIFTIHFGGNTPIFGNTHMDYSGIMMVNSPLVSLDLFLLCDFLQISNMGFITMVSPPF